MKEPVNIQEVATLSPDFMGFIFYEPSHRFVDKDFIISQLDEAIERVGVFVNSDFDFMIRQADKFNFSHIQLHGHETPELCHRLKLAGLKIIKAFSVDSSFDFKKVNSFQSVVDFFLFDTKGDQYGGTGKSFNWSLLDKYKLSTPFFLSGGLNPDNIGQAMSINHPALFALDLNSGFEERPGLKNVSKLKSAFGKLKSVTKV